MDQERAIMHAKKYANAVRSIMATQQIYLYGSQAKGNATEDSDIDIAVIVAEAPKDYLGTLTTLWQATYEVSNTIEPVLLVSGDNRSGFLQEVYRTGIAI